MGAFCKDCIWGVTGIWRQAQTGKQHDHVGMGEPVIRRGWGQEGQPGDTAVARTRVRQEWGGKEWIPERLTRLAQQLW